MQVKILGTVGVMLPIGVSVERFRTRKCVELLGLLVRHSGEFLSRESLGELLWPEEPCKVQRNRLRYELCQLRPLFSPVQLKTCGHDLICLSVGSDYADFEKAARQALRLPLGTARVMALEAALALCTGEFLPGHYANWVIEERECLEVLRSDLLYRLSTDCSQLGQREASRYWERKL
jgi:DNA-binding SARP family transcriptional activator